MNRLSNERGAQMLSLLVEGCAINSVVRITGAANATVLRLLVEAGRSSGVYTAYWFRGPPCWRIEADEIWSYVGAKQKNARHEAQRDLWTFMALDPDTKLMAAWAVGDRSRETADPVMTDLAARIRGRIRLSTGGHGMHLSATRKAFGWRIDYAAGGLGPRRRRSAGGSEGPGQSGTPIRCTCPRR